ncbi:hypothetical protein Q7C36_014231 [Tachysurus vachellii]|uniref:Uncharacterized protein n=1 Tax=Tachysurus vachellii TaxID=175792 RepID=A0AA88ME90_TACVA|nr:hypothetical protein Q7C36_014231 [Tachysurus vachellii]
MCPRPLGVSPKLREQCAAYSPGLVSSADMTPGSPSRRYVLYARAPVAHSSKIETEESVARWGGESLSMTLVLIRAAVNILREEKEQGARQQQRGQPLTSAAHPAHRNGDNSWSQADTDVDRQSGNCRKSHHNPTSEIYTDLLKLDTELPSKQLRDTCSPLTHPLCKGFLQDLDLD